jgi:predicted metal-dependent hydrolase
VVSGDQADYEACRQAIRRWLTRRAREVLIPRLASLARQHGLVFDRVSIRQQQSRWGSCSRRGSISLNAKLLFMPSAAADYVILHELCHTLVLDHSRRFWELMEEHDPEYRAHKRLVRAAAAAMPAWLDHKPDEAAM